MIIYSVRPPPFSWCGWIRVCVSPYIEYVVEWLP